MEESLLKRKLLILKKKMHYGGKVFLGFVTRIVSGISFQQKENIVTIFKRELLNFGRSLFVILD